MSQLGANCGDPNPRGIGVQGRGARQIEGDGQRAERCGGKLDDRMKPCLTTGDHL